MKKKLHFRKKQKVHIYFILSDENLFHPFYFLGLLQNISQKEFEINEFCLVKSILSKDGSKYEILERFKLN